MAGIKKTAGRFVVIAQTDGWPTWCEIQMIDDDGKLTAAHVNLRPDDLKDLQYCLGEVIAKLERDGRS